MIKKVNRVTKKSFKVFIRKIFCEIILISSLFSKSSYVSAANSKPPSTETQIEMRQEKEKNAEKVTTFNWRKVSAKKRAKVEALQANPHRIYEAELIEQKIEQQLRNLGIDGKFLLQEFKKSKNIMVTNYFFDNLLLTLNQLEGKIFLIKKYPSLEQTWLNIIKLYPHFP